jgi:excinuclease ABC subunit C
MRKSAASDSLARLRAIVAKAPTAPGVYRWLDAKGDVLYVGKAKNLRSRMKSYVLPAKDPSLGPWKTALIGKIADVEVTVTRSELEALVLETNLIKELKPKYNVMMKDDKNYVYVRISVQEAFPSVTVVRRMEEDKAKYFGPYLQAWKVRNLLDALHEAFPYRTAKETLDRLNRKVEKGEDTTTSLYPAPPLEVQIGRHCGLGCGLYSREQYWEALNELIRFFRGDHKPAAEALQREMQQAALDRKFERAGQLRDAVAIIREMDEEKQVVSDTTGDNLDIIGVALLKERAQVVLLRERGGKLIGEMSFSLVGQAGDIADVVSQFLPQYYSTVTDFPDTVLVAQAPEDADTLSEWLTERRGKRVEVAVPERGKKVQLLHMASRNAEEKIEQQLAKWEAVAKRLDDALKQLAELLQLPAPPKRIEGYDISHLGGTETVGSMVVLKDGKTANDHYRSFTIRTLKDGQIDDYAALREVLKRRLRHLSRDLKLEEAAFKERGVSFGRPRKAEVERIADVLGEAPPKVEYADLLVRQDDAVVGGQRALLHAPSTVELLPAVADTLELRQFLLRRSLASAKKEKLYIIVPDAEVEDYGELGFRHVQTIPKLFADRVLPGTTLLVSLPSERKIDPSLTARPDLLVIDGGKGQLSAALEALKQSGLDLHVVSLAKREEEVFVPGNPVPIVFPQDAQAKFLLMRLRDEAHRFANRHREQRGAKHAVESAIDNIPGIGEESKRQLLTAFGSVAGIRSASDTELRTILSPAQLAALRAAL